MTAQPAALIATADASMRSLHATSRTDVLWIGGVMPKPLRAALMTRHEIVEISADPVHVGAHAPRACALIIETRPDMPDIAWAAAVIDLAIDHGLRVILSTPDLSREGDEMDLKARDKCYQLRKTLSAGVVARYNDWHKYADAVGSYADSPGCNHALALGGDCPQHAGARILVRRAFHDFDGITMEQIPGGHSGAAVWIVRPSSRDGARRATPFLVKWNSIDKISEEKSNVTLYARDRMSFRLTPPLHQERCVSGATSALLVFDFIDRATTFADAIRSYPAGQLIGSLFDHTLSGSLGAARDAVGSVTAPFERYNISRWSEELNEAADYARLTNAAVSPMPQLRELLAAFPAVPHRAATVHGDMHKDNLLVAAGSSDVLLIDFGKIMYDMPAVSDAACLEVSLAFPPIGGREGLKRTAPSRDIEWLTRVYAYPLDPHAVAPRDDAERWLPEAVRALRGAARQHDPSAIAYAVAVLSYLLRFASYAGNGPVEDRAVAYALAARVAFAARNAARTAQP